MIELLDYILDSNDNFWIVNNITENIYKGYLVYKVSETGKYNNITGKYYLKDNDNLGIKTIPNNYKRIFKPRHFYKNNKNKLNNIWKDYVYALNDIGIEDDYIGIFGSYLIGFDINKDVDFCIYGIDNLYRYYNNINYIKNKLNVTSISKEHILYQYNKHKNKFNIKCDLKKIISRNWSGIQLSNGVLSTPRFIDLNNMKISIKNGVDKVIRVSVIEGILSNLLPRIAYVINNGCIYKIYSTLWKFQSFAKIGDILEIYANIDETNKLIIIDDEKYFIKYIE